MSSFLKSTLLHDVRNFKTCIYPIVVKRNIRLSRSCMHTVRYAAFASVFGRPFVKRFALCYRTVVCMSVCLSCLTVTLVHCGQTVRWIKMKLDMQVGLGPSHMGTHFPSSKGHSPQFSAHVCCGQTAGWIKMPLGTMVGLGPGNIVLDADTAPPPGGTALPIFGPCVLWPNRR